MTFSSDGDVNIQNLWQKAMLPAFNKVCPDIKINFIFDTHSVNANLTVSKIAAAIQQKQAVPIDVADNSVAEAGAQAGLMQTLTAAEIPNIANVDKTALARFKGTAIPYRGSSVLLAYDSTKVTAPPKTLKDLLTWITANPGKFTYNTPDSGGSGYSFVESVIDSHISADDLAKMQTDYLPDMESTWNQGLAELKSLTPSIYQNVYPKGNQAVLNLMGSGEIEMAPVWSDQFLSAQSQGQIGKEWKVSQISDPSFTGGAAYMGIVNTTTHAKAAEAFVNWVLEPAQQGTIVTTISGFPAIPLTMLPADAQSGFAGVDTQVLRPSMSSKMQADVKTKWTSTVPG